ELPWQPGAALVLADFIHHDGRPVAEAPRTVLMRQVVPLAKRKMTCAMASELEFFLFNTSYHEAFKADYRNLPPSSDYRIDYHTMQPARDEGFFRSIRNSTEIAGVPIEASEGWWDRAVPSGSKTGCLARTPIPIWHLRPPWPRGWLAWMSAWIAARNTKATPTWMSG